MSYNQSIVKNLLKSTVESERLKLLSELKLVHSADRLFHIFTYIYVHPKQTHVKVPAAYNDQ